MQFRVVSFIWLVIAVAFLALPGLRADEYRLYYLGGQSNMDGYGYVKELPDEASGEVPGVMSVLNRVIQPKDPTACDTRPRD